MLAVALALRGYGPVGNRLTEAAHAYGSVDLLPDDDGELS